MGRVAYLPDNTDEILDIITRYRAEYHCGPTLRELGELCGLSTSAMLYRVEQLEAHGYIARIPGKTRSMRVLTEQEREALHQA